MADDITQCATAIDDISDYATPVEALPVNTLDDETKDRVRNALYYSKQFGIPADKAFDAEKELNVQAFATEVLPAEPGKLFYEAFKQSLADKPAMMLRGTTAYTPGKALGIDPLLDKASLLIESLKDPETTKRVQTAASGKLWPIGDERRWWQVEAKYLPEVINAWAANVGDQIPIMLTTIAGRVAGKIIGKPIATGAGAVSTMVTGGPDPSDVATAPAVVGITQEVVKHLGGAAPMVAMEAGAFLDDATDLEIDADIAEKYARWYGIGSGTIEYAQQLWMLGRYSKIAKPAQDKILKQVLSHIGGSVFEGIEEISQGGLENWLLQKAVAEMKERHPDYEGEAPSIGEGWKRNGAVGFGVSLITTTPGTGMSIAKGRIARMQATKPETKKFLGEPSVQEVRKAEEAKTAETTTETPAEVPAKVSEVKPTPSAVSEKTTPVSEPKTQAKKAEVADEVVKAVPSMAAQPEAKQPVAKPKIEQAGGTAEETITPNLYIGNVTKGMKERISLGTGIPTEDIKGFTEGGFPTKRTKMPMTRREASNYLTWATGALDAMIAQVESKGSISLTYNQMAMTQALIGDIKALQEALGYTVKPAQITFKVAGKRRTASVGKTKMVSDSRFDAIIEKSNAIDRQTLTTVTVKPSQSQDYIDVGFEVVEKSPKEVVLRYTPTDDSKVSEQERADIIIAIAEEQALNKAIMELNVKQSIQQAVHPTEPSGMTVEQVFKAVMKGKEQAAEKAYIASGRDIVKQHKNLAAMAKDILTDLNITEAQRDRLLSAVARARTDKQQVQAMASVLAVRDDAVLKDQKKRFKELIRSIPKFYKQKALSDEAEQRVDELLKDVDIAKLSDAERAELEQVKKDLISYGFEIADNFSETAEEELDGIEEVIGAETLKNLKRMDKTPFADMTAEQREEMIDTLDYVLSQNTKERQEYQKQEAKRAEAVEKQSIKEIKPTAKSKQIDVKVAGKRISLPERIRNLITLDSLKRWALVERIVGRKGDTTSQVLDKDIHEGKNVVNTINKNVITLLKSELKRIGWNKADIERLDQEHTVKMGGAEYELTTSEIMSLGMNMRWKRNLKQILTADYLWIRDRKVNTPSLGEIYDAMELLSKKEKAVMDIVPQVNKSILMPAVNKTSKKLFGFGLAKEKNYWGLKRKIEKKARGKVIEGPAIEDFGMFQPFTGGTAPLIIQPFFNQFYTQIQNSASFAGLAIPMKRARTLLNSKTWRDAVDSAGRKEERLRITEIYRRSQGMANDYENVEAIAGIITRRAGKAILGWRVPTMAIQKASEPLAFSIIPVKYATPLPGLTVQKGAEQTKRMEEYSPFLWLRHVGGRVEIVTGDYAAVNAVNQIVFDQKTDRSLEGMRKVDWTVMQDIDALVQRWVSDTTKLKQGSDAYWKEVARRTEDVVRKTQPMWDIDERSVLSSSKNPLVKPVFMFRAAREAILNLNLMALDNVIKEGGAGGSKADLTKTLSSTLLSTTLVLAIRKASYVAIASAIAAMLGKDQPDEEELHLEVGDIAISYVNEIFGYLPLGSLATGMIKQAVGEPLWSEMDPDQVLYSIPINTGKALVDIRQSINAYYKDNDINKAVIELLDATNKLIEAGAAATGTPLMGPAQLTTKPLVRELKREEKGTSNRRRTTSRKSTTRKSTKRR